MGSNGLPARKTIECKNEPVDNGFYQEDFLRMSLTTKKKTMTKKKLIQLICQEKNLHPKDVGQVIQAFLDKITDSLANGQRLEFRDFGVFEVVSRKSKIGRNPKDPSVPIRIPERNAVKFIPGKDMRRRTEK